MIYVSRERKMDRRRETRLISVEKLVNLRVGLALHYLNQAKALWSEADLDYMLTS